MVYALDGTPFVRGCRARVCTCVERREAYVMSVRANVVRIAHMRTFDHVVE